MVVCAYNLSAGEAEIGRYQGSLASQHSLFSEAWPSKTYCFKRHIEQHRRTSL